MGSAIQLVLQETRQSGCWSQTAGSPCAMGLLGQVLLSASPGCVCRSRTGPPWPALRLPAAAASPRGPPDFSIQACDTTGRFWLLRLAKRTSARTLSHTDVGKFKGKMIYHLSGSPGSKPATVAETCQKEHEVGIPRVSKPRTASDNHKQNAGGCSDFWARWTLLESLLTPARLILHSFLPSFIPLRSNY